MIDFNGQSYLDDRVFVLEVCPVEVTSWKGTPEAKWSVITRRNVEGYPPFRCDDFDTMEHAMAYAESVEPSTPRTSLGGRSPNPAPSRAEYREWLASIAPNDPSVSQSNDPRA